MQVDKSIIFTILFSKYYRNTKSNSLLKVQQLKVSIHISFKLRFWVKGITFFHYYDIPR